MPQPPRRHSSFWHKLTRRHPEWLVAILLGILAIAATAALTWFLTAPIFVPHR